jgi:hypothetical protein
MSSAQYSTNRRGACGQAAPCQTGATAVRRGDGWAPMLHPRAERGVQDGSVVYPCHPSDATTLLQLVDCVPSTCDWPACLTQSTGPQHQHAYCTPRPHLHSRCVCLHGSIDGTHGLTVRPGFTYRPSFCSVQPLNQLIPIYHAVGGQRSCSAAYCHLDAYRLCGDVGAALYAMPFRRSTADASACAGTLVNYETSCPSTRFQESMKNS